MWLLSELLFIVTLLYVIKASPEEEVEGILNRLLGEDKASIFKIIVDPNISENGKETFQLLKETKDSLIEVSGSTGVAAAWGAHYYLSQHCGAHISWDGDQIKLPNTLPLVNQKVASLDKYKYYQNVCTSSYSFVWWDWDRWQREIDWMALQGVNLALAFGGQEAIWRRVYDGLGVNEDNFTGPAFLAWGRMGNIRGFGGGLSTNWHSKSVELQHKVLNRMRALGITPVLPAFNGILPPAFRKTYPSVTGTNISRWNSFPDEYCCPFLLDPADPMFSVVSRLFLREYIEEFGTDHIYNSDTFNENDPGSDDPAYLTATAQAIFQGIVEADPAAVWMIQGWAFLSPFWGPKQVEAYVTSIPIGSMLILDLQSDLTPLYETYDSYYGQPFIWCTLHNFGGQLGMFGHLERVNKGIVNGRNFANSTMVGVGITPEGIDQNYVMYEFTLNGTLQESERNVTEWIVEYARRRYGLKNEDIENAWQILQQTVYDYDFDKRAVVKKRQGGYTEHIERNILTKLPSLSLTEMSWYNKREVYKALQLFFNAAEKDELARNSKLFAHDLIDTIRQVVQLATSELYKKAVAQYRDGDAQGFSDSSSTFISILESLDKVLRTGGKFLLGTWLENAKSAGTTPEEKVNYEWNARNQITLWGPKGEIRDYAAKQWAGMIADFYKPRWETFFSALNTSLNGGESYNKTAVNENILNNIEIPFTFSQTQYPTVADPDPIGTALSFNQTWGSKLSEIFSAQFISQPISVIGYSEMQRHKNL